MVSALVSQSPPTLKLHFEPAGRPKEDRNYYLLDKQNICVVCGASENCVRKNIVPHEYRRYTGYYFFLLVAVIVQTTAICLCTLLPTHFKCARVDLSWPINEHLQYSYI